MLVRIERFEYSIRPESQRVKKTFHFTYVVHTHTHIPVLFGKAEPNPFHLCRIIFKRLFEVKSVFPAKKSKVSFQERIIAGEQIILKKTQKKKKKTVFLFKPIKQ